MSSRARAGAGGNESAGKRKKAAARRAHPVLHRWAVIKHVARYTDVGAGYTGQPSLRFMIAPMLLASHLAGRDPTGPADCP
jgi:hypothetical protein